MKPVKFEENELMVMAIFAEKTRQDTVATLKETLDVLEETKEDVSDEEMIEILSSLIEKLQQIEDKGYAKPFVNDPRKLFKIGVSFSIANRRIEEWKIAE